MSWDLIRPGFLYFMNAYSKNLNTLIGCEVGVDQGKNAVLMLEYCPRLHLKLVDIQPQPYAVGKFCVAHGRAEYIQKKSVEAAKDFADGYFDFVYIDADHGYMNVLRDLNAWYPKVKKGGVFAGHDWWYMPVRQAVLDFFRDKRGRLMAVQHFHTGSVLPTDAEMCDWFLRKE